MAESMPLLERKMEIPLPTFTFAKDTPQGKRPQAIAHRGYKARNPENTMSAFKDAVEVGAHAIETDVRLTKDGVVVLTHDPSLKRCFGQDRNVADCTWDDIKTLRSVQKPHEPVPRLKDLLDYLATPGLEDIWLLLDIKVLVPSLMQALVGDKDVQKTFDDYADDLHRSIAVTLADVKPSRPWNQRVVVGCWAAKYLPLCTKYFPGYPLTYIGFGIDYAHQFLKVPNVGINMFLMLIVGPRGQALLREVKKKRSDRSILLWTVNGESWMKWSIRQEVDGVITDDPKKYLEVCKNYNEVEKLYHSWESWKAIFYWHMRNLAFGLTFRYKHGFWVDLKKVTGNSGR
ncbi:glycerophosphoryl diester phosphodiesterase, putative [Talaromyces stipitatus ATCC 10500]|uniref:Glycerophosphoryl diester phosphodiesterase, putative n=1 Tax=Talaromyces stipitatus (strain ATCC 10500 / CBS 375.48 / QM 6759 / NRRL 1006) TaxID=441959 RepID=B8MT23_TALSN|nr:glycerophosphoryl diester phosphodiesterase, putative [Talaromyces stipitatus ATCC 10500]EED12103.1 glycerophosphoryl diester phosphodiesterase, putative [Talaromyces stipitatus ATCC 10500]